MAETILLYLTDEEASALAAFLVSHRTEIEMSIEDLGDLKLLLEWLDRREKAMSDAVKQQQEHDLAMRNKSNG